MKQNFFSVIKILSIILLIIGLSSCCEVIGLGNPDDAYIDIPNNKICNVSITMEYSLDGGSTWKACDKAYINVTFSVGDKVYVRQKGDASSSKFLGEVTALTGPDFQPTRIYVRIDDAIYNTYNYGTPGDLLSLVAYVSNHGTENFYASNLVRFYFSTDDEITTNDTLILETNAYLYSLTNYELGLDFRNSFTVPDLEAGTYYVGCILNADNAVTEINTGNNATLAKDVWEFTIVETNIPDGAIKIVNSWGCGGWEKVSNGYYWVDYKTVIKQQMYVRYYRNNTTKIYRPTAVIDFQLTHPSRANLDVKAGLGSPSSSYTNTLICLSASGAVPINQSKMRIDVTEFVYGINDFPLYFHVTNTGSYSGTIENLSLKLYSDYASEPFKTINATAGSFGAGGTTFYFSNIGALTEEEIRKIIPNPRTDNSTVTFIEEKPSDDELAAIIKSEGVYEKGKNYNKIIDGKYHTGYQPPTVEEWKKIKILRSVQNNMLRGTLPNTVDHMNTKYFPPVGNQGSEGSCTCFSLGYYIHTYTMAKENNWDLSSVKWLTTDPAGLSSGGAPDSCLDKIFSPDFLYHRINNGIDNGSMVYLAVRDLIVNGCATWSNMPYNTSDHTNLGSEAAWIEAPKYRGQNTGEFNCGSFMISNYKGIQLLKSVLNAGYCLEVTVKADETYAQLDANDVFDNESYPKFTELDHAQTIVGYKDGTAWDKSNPDN